MGTGKEKVYVWLSVSPLHSGVHSTLFERQKLQLFQTYKVSADTPHALSFVFDTKDLKEKGKERGKSRSFYPPSLRPPLSSFFSLVLFSKCISIIFSLSIPICRTELASISLPPSHSSSLLSLSSPLSLSLSPSLLCFSFLFSLSLFFPLILFFSILVPPRRWRGDSELRSECDVPIG